MINLSKEYKRVIDDFADTIFAVGKEKCEYTLSAIDPFKPHIYPFQICDIDKYVKFERTGKDTFFGYWQPCMRPAPLLIHTPGYGGEMSMHPELSEYFNVLHVNPLGIVTPIGFDRTKMTFEGLSSVGPDTIITGGKGGYFEWLSCVAVAIKWAWMQPNVISNRVSFFGTSQGGGTALLLGSIYSGRGTMCVAADQPFLTNYKLANGRGAYGSILANKKYLPNVADKNICDAIFCYDTAHHVYRYNFPVLLTSGGKDDVCPPDTIEALFNALSGTKSYTCFDELKHGYNRHFVNLARAWFLTYA